MRLTLRNVVRWIERHPVESAAAGLGAAALLGAGAGVVAAGGLTVGSTTTPRLNAGGNNSSVPSNYAADKLNFALRMWSGSEKALGDAVRAQSPVIWPGVPPEVFIGFCTNGARTANTAAATGPTIPNGNPFAEMGYFGTEGGPRSTPRSAGPYPHPTSTEHNSWLALHRDPLVVRALGRPAPMGHNAWQTDVAAQAAVGLVNLRRRLDAVNRAVPAGCGAADPASAWAVALAFAGWSAGVGGTDGHITRYAAVIAPAPEAAKLQAWISGVVADARAGRFHGRAGKHDNPAYSLVRTLQKIEAGRALAVRVNSPRVGWFPVVSAADQLAVTRAAFHRPPG